MLETNAGHIIVIADLRERASGIPRALSQKGLEVRLQRLEIGDYILAPHVAVERKTMVDFVQSIFDKRLFAQVSALRTAYVAPILLLEKCETPAREIHPHACRGAMLYVSLLNRIPILQTENAADTVDMLFAMVQLIYRETTKEFSLHAKRRSQSPQNTQRYILETIPGIGPHLAHELLRQFGTLQAVFTASSNDLMSVPGIGHQRAEKIRALLQREYR
jgi:Fanconi anemia group M protein